MKISEAVPAEFYITPGLQPFYYNIDPDTYELTATSPQVFHVPVVVENL